MPWLRSLFTGVMLTTAVVSVSEAQNSKTPSIKHVEVASITARSEDVSSIDGIMKAYYETISGPAGQPREWSRERTLWMPGAQIVLITEDEKGNRAPQMMTHDEFVDLADLFAVKNGFFEREIHRTTHRYADWAHIVSTSEARATPTGPVTGHGIDNVELFWDGKRWWITQNSIVSERAKEPLPKEYLP